jgi:hypothetical protein
VITHRHRIIAASGEIHGSAATIKVMRAVVIPGILVFFAVLLRAPVFDALLLGLVEFPAGCLLLAAALQTKRECSNKSEGYCLRSFHQLLLTTALLVFIPAAAGAWIIPPGLGRFSDNLLDRQRLTAHKIPCSILLAE